MGDYTLCLSIQDNRWWIFFEQDFLRASPSQNCIPHILLKYIAKVHKSTDLGLVDMLLWKPGIGCLIDERFCVLLTSWAMQVESFGRMANLFSQEDCGLVSGYCLLESVQS